LCEQLILDYVAFKFDLTYITPVVYSMCTAGDAMWKLSNFTNLRCSNYFNYICFALYSKVKGKEQKTNVVEVRTV